LGKYNACPERIRRIEVWPFEKFQNWICEVAEDKGMLLRA
jgi:hypothetical protein